MLRQLVCIFGRHVVGPVDGMREHSSIVDQAILAIGYNAVREKPIQ